MERKAKRESSRGAWRGVLFAAMVVACAAGSRAEVWAPGTVWPARVPVRIEVELPKAGALAWAAEETGRSPGEVGEREALEFLAGEAHALGTAVGDTEEALALRPAAEATRDSYRVAVVARNAYVAAAAGETLIGAELVRRAARLGASVGWATGEAAANRLRQNRAVAKLAGGDWASPNEMLEQLRTLAALDPGWLFAPYPAFDAWKAGPGRGKEVRVLEALRALGVYTDPEHGPYAAWNPTVEGWEEALIFEGAVSAEGQPLPEATAVIRLAEARGAAGEDQGRLDAVATGPDGTFYLALRGAQATRYAGNRTTEFQINVRKWGYDLARVTARPGGTQVTDVGRVELKRSSGPSGAADVSPRELLLEAPRDYRTLTSSATDDGGEQRFYLSRSRQPAGSRRLFTSSSDISYVFERAEGGTNAARWLDQVLDTDAAKRMRRTPATKQIDARVLERKSDRGQIVVTESGEWRLDDGTTVYHTSEVRILAFAIGGYRARLQVTAIGTSPRSSNRDPEGFVAAAGSTADTLGRTIEQRLSAPAASVRRVDRQGDWFTAECLTRLYANVIGLDHGSVMMESGEFDAISRRMPLARQVIRVEDEPVTFTLGDNAQVIAEPNSTVRFSHDGRLRLLSGRFHLKTAEPNGETDQHLQHLGWLIFQTQQAEEDFARSVERAVRLNHISAAYGDELLTLSRESALRSLFAICQWLAADDMLMIQGRMPLLCFGESELLLEQDNVATLNCLTGRAFLGEESFTGVARLQAGETSTSRPGKPPTQPGVG